MLAPSGNIPQRHWPGVAARRARSGSWLLARVRRGVPPVLLSDELLGPDEGLVQPLDQPGVARMIEVRSPARHRICVSQRSADASGVPVRATVRTGPRTDELVSATMHS